MANKWENDDVTGQVHGIRIDQLGPGINPALTHFCWMFVYTFIWLPFKEICILPRKDNEDDESIYKPTWLYFLYAFPSAVSCWWRQRDMPLLLSALRIQFVSELLYN